MSVIFRPLSSGEEKYAAQIEAAALDTAWSESQIAETLSNENAFYGVAVCEGRVCGIGSIYCIAGEGQIMNIAVGEDFRKMGIGEGVLNLLNEAAKEKNCENITLEVAENNIPAISLYKKCGYTVIARRKGFYRGIDALVMEKIL